MRKLSSGSDCSWGIRADDKVCREKENDKKRFEETFDGCLFRYRRINRFNMESLASGRMHFIPPSVLRDPYDTELYADPRVVEERIGNKVGSVSTYLDGAKLLIRKNAKVICFTEVYDSLTMWSQYADEHKGYVLIYGKEDLKTAAAFDAEGFPTDKDKVLEKVEYVSERMDLTVEVEKLLQMDLLGSMGGLQDPDSGIDQRRIRKALLQKYEERNYEREWRLMSASISFWRHSPLYYIECKPRGMILGSRCEKEDAEDLTSIAEKSGLPVYQMISDPQCPSYELMIKAVRV